LIPFFYTLNLLLLLLGCSGIRLDSGERRFSIALVQTLLVLPLLAGEYFYLDCHLETQAVKVVLFSEIVFALIWLSMALRFCDATVTTVCASRLNLLIEMLFVTVVTTAAGYFLVCRSLVEISDATLAFQIYSPVYFSTAFILMAVFYAAWRLEYFWRALNVARRWEYKFLIIGTYLVCGAIAWSASYRLTYMTILPGHILLLTALLLFAWALMLYAVVRHRLLNRKIFVSRKVVYSFAVPSLLAAYFLLFGILSLIIRTFGLHLSFVLKWLFVALGFIATGLFAFSEKIRRRVHFFISTHFYINKYEYRDEWLALSQQLQGAMTEADVVNALRQVLVKSLYTTEIFIWLGDSSQGYKLVSLPENLSILSNKNDIVPNDPLVRYIKAHYYFHAKKKEPDPEWQKVMECKRGFLASLNLILIASISIGNYLVGLIGLGPEFTGGQYGYDDFDLLTAIGSQTASALLTVRMAEKLANTRKQQALNQLSAFVLHDIKNAATMLSLLRDNAPEHIHEPEFQQDMLEVVDDALRRMSRVEQRLGTLKDEITPVLQNIELGRFLRNCRLRLKKKLASMEITVECKNEIQLITDPDILFSVLENLLLNAFEARKEGAIVKIIASSNDDAGQAIVEVIDNGPGIPEDLLPDLLFEPFKTDKDGGSGIGLWQVKKMVDRLGGSVSAENRLEGGARLVMKLPLSTGDG
jgi:putative PEP-CTERM system histidine kinase